MRSSLIGLASFVGFGNKNTFAIYDQNYNQIFVDAAVMKADVNITSKLMDHTLETGEVVTDHRIINPIAIDIILSITSSDYQSVYQEISQVFNDDNLLIVQTKAATFFNQVIEAIPHVENPDFFDSLIMNLKTREVAFATPETEFAPADEAQASTVDTGTVEAEVTEADTSSTTLRDLFSSGS